MYWDVKVVHPLKDYRLYVELADNRKGIFDLKPYLHRGVFQELRDVHSFNQVGILFGAVTWPNQQDIAPETLVAEMIPLEANKTLSDLEEIARHVPFADAQQQP